MIDCEKELVKALKTILPVYWERRLSPKCKIPCISYEERNNADVVIGDTLGYSTLGYTIKVWATSKEDLQKYSLLVDKVMKSLNWTRTGSGELFDNNSTVCQKILEYDADGVEFF